MTGNAMSARSLEETLAEEGVALCDVKDEGAYDILPVHMPIPPWNALEVRMAKKKGIPVVIHAHATADDAEGTWTGRGVLSGWGGYI